jgi:tetratricopeptide (TPR) repeat protein
MRAVASAFALVIWLVGPIGVAVPRAEATDLDARSRAQEAVAAYDQAMASMDRDARLEHFRRAERLFSSLVDEGYESADLYTNTGNAALQAEHLGAAVLSYRRALALAPGSEPATQNLGHARGLLPDWVPTPPEAGVLDSFFFWSRNTSRASREQLAAACFGSMMLCLGGALYTRRAGLRLAAAASGVLWIGLIVTLFFGPTRDAGHQGVISQATVARAADSINAPRRFSDDLPAGTEVRILEDRGGWLQIELHNGRNGWIIASALERVGRF